MKAHKYWAIGAAVAMAGTFYTGYKMISGKTSKASEKAE